MGTQIAGVEMSMAQPDKNAASVQEQYQAALAAVTAPAFRTASARDKQEYSGASSPNGPTNSCRRRAPATCRR